MEGVGFSGRFTAEVWEEGQLIDVVNTPNRILRSGLRAIVMQGLTPGAFSNFAVGSSQAPDRPSYDGLVAPLGGGAPGSAIPNMPFGTWGYEGVFGVGSATGQWGEIGMNAYSSTTGPNSGMIILNRALFLDQNGNPRTINKGLYTIVKVSVKFSIFRV